MDNFWLGGFWLAEAERERGGWCIIGGHSILWDCISHYEMVFRDRNQGYHESATDNASNPRQNRLQRVYMALPYLPLRNHINRF